MTELPVTPARYPWRLVGGATVLLLLAMFVSGLLTNPAWDWKTFSEWLFEKSIMNAVLLTLQLTLFGGVIGFAGGVVLAMMRLSSNPILRATSWSYVWLFRSIPLIVQLLFWGNISYLYSTLSIGIPFGPSFAEIPTLHLISGVGAAIIGLSLHESAYAAEIVRSGILSVDQGQLEAGTALGIPKFRQFRRIIFPQAMRTILPNAANLIISLLKGTSVVYVLAIGELFYQVQVIYGGSGQIVPLLMVASVWYVILVSVMSVGQFYLERHFSKGALRTLPPTPLQKLRMQMTTLTKLGAR
ncbi:amino acid ABC transporter permease [Rhodococcus sp. IEGM 1379]|uniref:amino acid ABC transporter permease n=1 Tax=Rhodococcus sp. IEGM 1379 TaxID=3047086 RepID=UPI0024B6D48C|nr:amino acid ABC transporter permease [Rhodococcus sp. IEGM 1379]MDI9914184.1 amino acid ABC transporter permease [Rhodococcus sp. IEGM 1379]